MAPVSGRDEITGRPETGPRGGDGDGEDSGGRGGVRRIVEDAGLPPIDPRDLRHLAATLIHAGGGDIHAVEQTLRHSTIRLASDTCTSPSGEVDVEVAGKAAALVPLGPQGPDRLRGARRRVAHPGTPATKKRSN